MSSEKGQLAPKSGPEAIVITRIFDAPRELVWKAWTDPNQVMKWWAPKPFSCPVCEIDFRIGGKYFTCMRTASGPEIWQKGIYGTGVYQEIVPFEKIVFSDSFADEKGNVVPASYYGMEGDFALEMRITVVFEVHKDNKTRITMTHEGLPAGEHRTGASQGWNESFDKLSIALDDLKTS